MASRAIDIVNLTAEAIGWPRIDAFDMSDLRTSKLVNLLNRALSVYGDMFNWRFLRADGEVLTKAVINAGTCAVTAGVNYVTFAGVSIGSDRVNSAFQVDGDNVLYRIVEVSSSTRVLLNRAYLGTTNALATYQIATDRYELPEDFNRPLNEWTNFFGNAISPVDPDIMAAMRRAAITMQVGTPDSFTIYDLSDTGNQLVHLHPFPEEVQPYPFQYQKHHPKIVSPGHVYCSQARAKN